jgi:hypothetical protein
MRRRRGECTPPPRRRTPAEVVRGVPKTAPSDSLGPGAHLLVGGAIRPIYTAFRAAQDLPG